MFRFTIRSFVLVAGIALLSSAALAADPAPGTPADPTPAQRQTMAELHRKMADCLASDRPFADCRAEMHQGCMTAMGANGCPMMMGGGMGGGMMRGRGMMGGQTPPAPPPSPSK